MLEQLGLSIEELNAIIMALIAALTGTGIFALMAKVAINRAFKLAKQKIDEAVKNNKLAQIRAEHTAEHLELEQKMLNEYIDKINSKLDNFMELHISTDKSIGELAESIKTRDKKIADMLEKELTDSEEK